MEVTHIHPDSFVNKDPETSTSVSIQTLKCCKQKKEKGGSQHSYYFY